MISRAGNRGLTLIEVIAVIFLLSLATSVVIVSVAGSYDKSLIKREARKVYASLKHARETAIARHYEVTFETDEENTAYTISAREKRIIERSMPKNMSIRSEPIVFYPLGDSSGGIVTVTDDNERTYEITISNITGKAKIERLQSP